jgi:hypothetical protein
MGRNGRSSIRRGRSISDRYPRGSCRSFSWRPPRSPAVSLLPVCRACRSAGDRKPTGSCGLLLTWRCCNGHTQRRSTIFLPIDLSSTPSFPQIAQHFFILLADILLFSLFLLHGKASRPCSERFHGNSASGEIEGLAMTNRLSLGFPERFRIGGVKGAVVHNSLK